MGWEGPEPLPGYALVSVGLASVSLSLKPLWENRGLEVLSTGSCSSSDGSGARDFQWLVGLQREEQGQGQIILLLLATKALSTSKPKWCWVNAPGLTQEMLIAEKGAQGSHSESFGEYQDREAGGSRDQGSVSLRKSCMFLAPSPEKLGLSHGEEPRHSEFSAPFLQCRWTTDHTDDNSRLIAICPRRKRSDKLLLLLTGSQIWINQGSPGPGRLCP